MDTEANETMAERPEVYGFLAPVLMIAMLVIAFVGASIGWIDLAEQANLTDIGLTTIVLLVATGICLGIQSFHLDKNSSISLSDLYSTFTIRE